VCQRVPKKLVVLACLTMSKLKMNQRAPNKKADLLKKIGLMGTETLMTTLTLSVTIKHKNLFWKMK